MQWKERTSRKWRIHNRSTEICLVQSVRHSNAISSKLQHGDDDVAAATDFPQLFDPILLPVAKSFPTFLNISKSTYTRSSPFRLAYWIHTNYLFRALNPPPIVADEPEQHEKLNLWKTSHQAKVFNCQNIAINGGPFHADGTSCGPIVVNGTLLSQRKGSPPPPVASPSPRALVGVGVTDRANWFLGSYSQFQSVVGDGQRLQYFVTGFHWLVYNGTVVAKNNDDDDDDDITNSTITQRAPRTAIGIKSDGSVTVLVVDGCEYCKRNPGVSLIELAQMILKEPGVIYAINFDGGGSTTLVNSGKVFNRPRCLDVDFLPCERRVASVICLDAPTSPCKIKFL